MSNILNQIQKPLKLTRVDNGRLHTGADRAGVATKGLDLLDDLEGVVVGNLTKDDMLTVQPRGHDGGDEELGAVAVYCQLMTLIIIEAKKKPTC